MGGPETAEDLIRAMLLGHACLECGEPIDLGQPCVACAEKHELLRQVFPALHGDS